MQDMTLKNILSEVLVQLNAIEEEKPTSATCLKNKQVVYQATDQTINLFYAQQIDTPSPRSHFKCLLHAYAIHTNNQSSLISR